MSAPYRLVSLPREARRLLVRVAWVAAAAPALAGCSFSIPSLTAKPAPEETTGSISPAPTVLRMFPDLGPEEARRARAALAVALDPQGNGQPVKWDNPESGMRGEIVPHGPPFVESDEICRLFAASLDTGSASKRAEGKACRVSAGEWVLRKLQAKRQS
ncbi:RT0821/Lpp0805 family surface protein [Enterovirga aerilata]|uniref:Surface antigen domain-containing protein n=1 Tax=Enterovirga aerilata TaxID=2730920 RepID=A0A849IFE2_9HYPH|nr:RT0821/Lpp0805 family surface protein [Enterovirga sp. DB1703]NNM74850.1 hypothetical protein [Enterovirga sp. DB1703]